MLVNTHKLIGFLGLFFGYYSIAAQEAWTLKQCIDSALVYNKSLQINHNNRSISLQDKKVATAYLAPKITANADYKYFAELPTQLMPINALNPQAPEGQFNAIQFGVPHNISANLQLAMPLYDPQVYGALEKSKIAENLSHLQYQKAEEQVLYDVTTLYYNAQILMYQRDFLDSNLQNTQRLLANMELLKNQLMARGTDVDKVQLQARQLHLQRENAHHKYLSVLQALKLNIGIPLERDIAITSEIKPQPLVTNRVEATLDQKVLEAKNKLLTAELGTLNRSRLLPSLKLMASYGTTGFGYDQSPNSFLDFYPIGFAGLQLQYPLFNGTVTTRKAKKKQLEIRNNELQAELISERHKMETENSRQQRAIALTTVNHAQDHMALAQSIYDQTILQQKQGTATLADVLLADNALREAQQNYLSAVVDLLKADLELKRLSGNIHSIAK